MKYIMFSAEVNEVTLKDDVDSLVNQISSKRIVNIVSLLASRSLSHLSKLQEEFYQVN